MPFPWDRYHLVLEPNKTRQLWHGNIKQSQYSLKPLLMLTCKSALAAEHSSQIHKGLELGRKSVKTNPSSTVEATQLKRPQLLEMLRFRAMQKTTTPCELEVHYKL